MVEAPSTRLILISFCRCCVVNAVRPNKPRQVMIIVSMENDTNIFPLFWSAVYCELKSSYKNLYSNGSWGKYFFQAASTFEIAALRLVASIFNCIMLQLGE